MHQFANTTDSRHGQDINSSTMTALGAAADQRCRANGFTVYLSELAGGTCRVYRADLEVFARCLEALTVHSHLFDGDQPPSADQLFNRAATWQAITYEMVDLFVQWLKLEGYAIASIRRKLATVRVFSSRAGECGAMPADTAAAIRGIRVPSGKRARNLDETRQASGIPTRIGHKKANAVFVEVDKMRRLRDDHENTPQGRRNRLAMTLLIELGLRVSEVAALTVDDVNIAANLLHVYRIKTDLDQWLEMTPTLLTVMTEWLNHDVDPDQTDAPLLRGTRKGGNLTHKGLTTRSINRIVGQQGRRLGIKNLSPHDLRHSWTDINMDRVSQFERGKDTVRQAGGWKTSTMVDRYAQEKAIANQGMGSALD